VYRFSRAWGTMSVVVRRSAVAGSWYPGTAQGVAAEVDRYLLAAGASPEAGRLVGLISPHAGLRYSGPVAAYGYSQLQGRKSLTVVLVGPSHHAAFEGVAACGSESWETPLGRVAVERGILAELVADGRSGVFEHDGAHREEHSLEMQLPFLQRVVSSLSIVPLLMGSQSRAEVTALAEALARVLRGREVLLVASSDLSHYQPAVRANQRDRVVLELVARFDCDTLLERLEREDNVACGGGPIVAVMRAAAALGAERARILRYADSGDVAPHDKSHVVGYLSAALSASGA
jgi:AmmeMemoRadiSam system protein B